MRKSTRRNLILSIALIVTLILIAAAVIFLVTENKSSHKSGSAGKTASVQSVSPTEAPIEAVPEDKSEKVVEMEPSKEDSDGFKNVIGEKSAVSSKVIFTNETAFTMTGLYLRRSDGPKTDTAWSQELFHGKFTLKDKEQALYYYTESDSDAKKQNSYDIRMELDFGGNKTMEVVENVRFTGTKEIILHLDVSGDYGVGYAEYVGSDGKKYSTRDTAASQKSEETEPTSTPVPEEAQTQQTPAPTEEPENNTEEYEDTDIMSDDASTATQFIGQSFGNLESALGSPMSSEYEDEPDTGVTGYHYYSNFTVSTTVDESGNEIVSGIW